MGRFTHLFKCYPFSDGFTIFSKLYHPIKQDEPDNEHGDNSHAKEPEKPFNIHAIITSANKAFGFNPDYTLNMTWCNLSQMFEETYWINKEQEKEIEKNKTGTAVKKEEKSMTIADLGKLPGTEKLE